MFPSVGLNPGACKHCGRARPKSEAKSSIHFSHVGGRDLSIWPNACYPLECTLAGNWTARRLYGNPGTLIWGVDNPNGILTTLSQFLGYCYIIMIFYLKKKKKHYGGRDIGISSNPLPHSPNGCISYRLAKVKPGAGTPSSSPTWVAEAWDLQTWSTVFPCTLGGSWSGSIAAGAWPRTTIWNGSFVSWHFTCSSTTSAFPSLFVRAVPPQDQAKLLALLASTSEVNQAMQALSTLGNTKVDT